MNLLDMTISDSKLKKGDLLRFERGVYSHWGVYVGDGNVIHLGAQPDAGPSAAFDSLSSGSFFGVLSNKASVRKDTLQDVAKNSNVYRSNQFDGMLEVRYTEDEIVRRAESFLGKIGYNVITFNCEHFANYVRYGIPLSNQVRIDPRFNGHSVYYELPVVLTNSTERHQNSRFSSPHTNNFGITNYERNEMQLRLDEIKHDCLPIGRYCFRAKLGNSVSVNIEVNVIPLSTGHTGHFELLVKRINSTETRQNSHFSSPHKNNYSITNYERNKMQFRLDEKKRDCLPVGRYCFRAKLGNSVSMNIEVTITPSDNGSADYHKLFDEMTKHQNYYISHLLDQLAMTNYEYDKTECDYLAVEDKCVTILGNSQSMNRKEYVFLLPRNHKPNLQNYTASSSSNDFSDSDYECPVKSIFTSNSKMKIQMPKDPQEYTHNANMTCPGELCTLGRHFSSHDREFSNNFGTGASNITNTFDCAGSSRERSLPVSNVSGIEYHQSNTSTGDYIGHKDTRSKPTWIDADNAKDHRLNLMAVAVVSGVSFSVSPGQALILLFISAAFLFYLYLCTEKEGGSNADWERIRDKK